jgi:acetyl esterase/lipase
VDASLTILQAWRSAGASAELHVFEQGGHGFGLTPQNKSSDQWPQLFEQWLRTHGFASRP